MNHFHHPGKRDSPLRNIMWFASSNLFRQLLGAVTAFLRPLLLSPEQFGVFSLLRTFPLYAQSLHFGARTGLRYLIPLYESRGQTSEIAVLKGTVLKASITANVVMAAIMVAVAADADMMAEMRVGLVLTAVFALVSCYSDHYVSELKGHQRFKIVGISNYVSAVVLLAASVPLMLWYGLYGALLAQIVTTLVLIGWFLRKRIAGPRPGFNWGMLKIAAVMGLPTLLFNAVLLMIRTADRFIISQTIGFENLGYYALGTMVIGYLLDIPGATREVMEGQLFQKLDAHSQAEAFRRYAQQPMVRMSFTMPWVIGPVYLALPVVIDQILPHYRQGVPAAQLLCLGAWFLAVSYPIRGILVANRWQVAALVILMAALGLHVGLSLYWLSTGGGIEMVAVSTGIAFLVVLTGTFTMALFRLAERPADLARDCLLMAVMPLATTAVLWRLEQLRPTGSLWIDLAAQGLLLSVFLAATAIVAVRLQIVPPTVTRKVISHLGRLAGRKS